MLNNQWPISNIFHRLRTKIDNSKKICLSNFEGNTFSAIINKHPELIVLNKNGLSEKNKVYDFSYDYIFFNNLMLEISVLKELKKSNIHIVVFNHENLTRAKKEDVHIINNNLTKEHITIINFNRKSDAQLEHSHNIEYGLPYIDDAEKTKNILIINRNNDNILSKFFQEIQQHDKDSDMVSSLGDDIDNIVNNISKYKVVIDLESKVTLLLSALCKCNCITTLDTSDSILDNHVSKFGSFQNPFECINYAMNKQATDISDLVKMYDMNKFNESLIKIL